MFICHYQVFLCQKIQTSGYHVNDESSDCIVFDCKIQGLHVPDTHVSRILVICFPSSVSDCVYMIYDGNNCQSGLVGQ